MGFARYTDVDAGDFENIEYGTTNEEIIENPSGTHLTARFARAAAEPSMGSPAGSDRVIQL